MALSNLDSLVVWLSGGVCAQNPAHSFWLNGRPLPLCARDLGLFLGFLAGLPLSRLLPRAGPAPWLFGLVPLPVDGANSLAADVAGVFAYAPNNGARLFTGLLGGLCLAALISPAARSLRSPAPLAASSRQRILGLALPLRPPAWTAVRLAPPAISMAALILLGWRLDGGYLALAAAGLAGILALLATASTLARPSLSRPAALALALPELAALAALKHTLLGLLM